MIVLGLTGSIAMGKSTAAAIFRSFGVPVFDADAAVHDLFRPLGAAVGPVDRAFPGCLDGAGGIDRAALGRAVFDRPDALCRLEAIVHPLVRAAERTFLSGCRRRGQRIAVLDIPLLFETGADRRVDAVAVVSAPAFVQEQRALRRGGMSRQRLDQILARQTFDREKRRRADFVIPSGLGRRTTVEAIARLLDTLRGGARTQRKRGR